MISPPPSPPPSWVAGSPGDKNHRRSESPASVDMALDAIQANEIERQVGHFLSRVNSPRYALKIIISFRCATASENHPT